MLPRCRTCKWWNPDALDEHAHQYWENAHRRRLGMCEEPRFDTDEGPLLVCGYEYEGIWTDETFGCTMHQAKEKDLP